MKKILVANRGEVALRILRAADDLGLAAAAVYARDDADALHVRAAAQAVALPAQGPAAYLDRERLIAAARETGCDAVHPGYGFLSERADFARACAGAGLTFIGPTPEQLEVFGDKARARALAAACDVPLVPGTPGPASLEEAHAFFAAHREAGVMIKAVGGGGGRGMRAVFDDAQLADAYARCASEARAAFGVDGVYLERLVRHARHIEVQVVGDGRSVVALGERECTLQRRFQKLVEIAPSPSLEGKLRGRIVDAALRLARAVGYLGLGTFEFLVEADSGAFFFIEANPRLQVEHTITEEVTGVDLVRTQIGIAAGRPLDALGLDPAASPAAQGYAMQLRINAETIDDSGNAMPASGVLNRFDLPGGPGVRVDTHGYLFYRPSPYYDTLLAKLVVSVRGGDFAGLVRRARRALGECRIDGIATNLPLLRALAAQPEFERQEVDTGYVERHLSALLEQAKGFAAAEAAAPPAYAAPVAGDAVDDADGVVIRAPMAAKVVKLSVAPGEVVRPGGQVAVLEAMKMEAVLLAEQGGRVRSLHAAEGEFVAEGQALVLLEPAEVATAVEAEAAVIDVDAIRPDLQAVLERHAYLLDENRPDAVARRRKTGQRTARENVTEVCDPGSFIEYGALAIAAQRRRRPLDDLVRNTPADGMITGIGTVNRELFGAEQSRCVVMAYDYTVLAGTQGFMNHAKTDRMLDIAGRLGLPVVLFAEGGGGRPGDTDMPVVAGLHVPTFASYARLSGKVPLVGIVSGRCFAGNAALLGCSDVIIATPNSNIGMSGPAMIEGGGLGSFRPEDIGPTEVQSRNGVADLVVADEREAAAAARRYLAYFQGALPSWDAPDQRLLRHAVPENRRRVYDVRTVMQGLVDTGSLMELRAGFGAGILTALARIEGRPIGLIANNPRHLGGAIDVDAADKAARFMQLCDAYGLPIVSLVDTPGFMVGPDIESRAQVRHVCRMFVTAANLRVPYFAVVLRKGYGLGAQAMAGGGFHSPVFTIAWPTGEFGAMGIEGAVRLGYRKELEAAAEGPERDALFNKLVAAMYDNGKALNMAAMLEIDAVIDPAETRAWLTRGLQSAAAGADLKSPRARFIDTW
ncbi:MAG: carboxyl transferase domain-containing protein [Pseudomonadota bacterium]